MSAAPAFALPWAIDVDGFDRWVAGAAERERLVYARGASIPRQQPGWKHAAALAADGVITLTSRVAPDQPPGVAARVFEYLAVRLSPAIGEEAALVAAATAARERARAAVLDEDDPTEAMFRAAKRAVNMGGTLPCNEQLARACGLKDGAAASYRLRLLIQAGRIAVHDQGPGQPRRVVLSRARAAGQRNGEARR